MSLLARAFVIVHHQLHTSSTRLLTRNRPGRVSALHCRSFSVRAMAPPIPSLPLGHRHPIGKDGAVVLEAWLDYTCPFSKKFFDRMTGEVIPHYDGKLRFTFQQAIQPWHPQSTMCHETALAVARLGGEDAFWAFSAALFKAQEEFFDVPTLHLTRAQIYAKLAKLAGESCGGFGVKEADVAALLVITEAGGERNGGTAVVTELKFYVRLMRQLGVHVSPTCLLNSLVVDTSSSWDLAQWRALLDPVFAGKV